MIFYPNLSKLYLKLFWSQHVDSKVTALTPSSRSGQNTKHALSLFEGESVAVIRCGVIPTSVSVAHNQDVCPSIHPLDVIIFLHYHISWQTVSAVFIYLFITDSQVLRLLFLDTVGNLWLQENKSPC